MNDFSGCWLVYGWGCLMQRQYVVKMAGECFRLALLFRLSSYKGG